MKKILVFVMVMTLLLGCTACGDSGSSSSGSDVSLRDIKDKMITADASLETLKYVDINASDSPDKFKTLVDFDYGKVEDYFYGFDKDGKAPEVIVVKVKDEADVPDLVAAFKTRAADRKGTFENYDPDQVALVEHYVLTHAGDTVAFIISEKNGLAEKAFKECF